MLVRFLPFYTADVEGGSGGGSSGDDQGKIKPSDVLERHGSTAESALRIAEKLAESENANYSLREKNRALRQQLSEAQAKATPEGAVILTKEDAALLEAYRALGKPDELKAVVTERDTLKTDNVAHKHALNVQAAAEAHGYKAAALGKLPSLAGRSLVIKDGTDAEGKATKQAFVVVEGKETALPDYIQANDPEFLSALTVAQDTRTAGTAYVAQSTGGKAPVKNAAQEHIKKTKYAVPGGTGA